MDLFWRLFWGLLAGISATNAGALGLIWRLLWGLLAVIYVLWLLFDVKSAFLGSILGVIWLFMPKHPKASGVKAIIFYVIWVILWVILPFALFSAAGNKFLGDFYTDIIKLFIPMSDIRHMYSSFSVIDVITAIIWATCPFVVRKIIQKVRNKDKIKIGWVDLACCFSPIFIVATYYRKEIYTFIKVYYIKYIEHFDIYTFIKVSFINDIANVPYVIFGCVVLVLLFMSFVFVLVMMRRPIIYVFLVFLPIVIDFLDTVIDFLDIDIDFLDIEKFNILLELKNYYYYWPIFFIFLQARDGILWIRAWWIYRKFNKKAATVEICNKILKGKKSDKIEGFIRFGAKKTVELLFDKILSSGVTDETKIGPINDLIEGLLNALKQEMTDKETQEMKNEYFVELFFNNKVFSSDDKVSESAMKIINKTIEKIIKGLSIQVKDNLKDNNDWVEKVFDKMFSNNKVHKNAMKIIGFVGKNLEINVKDIIREKIVKYYDFADNINPAILHFEIEDKCLDDAEKYWNFQLDTKMANEPPEKKVVEKMKILILHKLKC